MSLKQYLMNQSWLELLEDEFEKNYWKHLNKFILKEYDEKIIYPPKELVFNTLNHCSYDDVKVCVIGMDPYHEKNQAMGFSFSVPPTQKLPSSLRNIYKEMKTDVGECPENGDLTHLVNQGFLLLNTILTVEEGKANSHRNKGWEIFTNEIISILNSRDEPIIFVLWGRQAQEKEKLIDNKKHHIIKSVHPSGLSASRGFFGSKPFSKIEEYLGKRVSWTKKIS